jgi:hypothetical protein
MSAFTNSTTSCKHNKCKIARDEGTKIVQFVAVFRDRNGKLDYVIKKNDGDPCECNFVGCIYENFRDVLNVFKQTHLTGKDFYSNADKMLTVETKNIKNSIHNGILTISYIIDPKNIKK